jgi:hypothetical protein
MILLLNVFKATPPAAETLPVGYFFNHLSRSNDKNNPRGQPLMPKLNKAYSASG